MDKKKLRVAIKKQMKMIGQTGFEPEWNLFEKTFGWFQIKQKLTEEQIALYEEIWIEEYQKSIYKTK